MQKPECGGFERFSGAESGGARRAWHGTAYTQRPALADSAAWTLFQKSGEPLLLVSADSKVRFANHAAHRVLKFDANTIEGREWLVWVHPAHQDALHGLLDKLRRQPESHDTCEAQLRDGSGLWRWFEISLTNLLVDSLGWLVQLRDVTSRHECEERHRHFAAQFAEAQRLAALGTWEWDVQSNRLLWSQELYHIIGIPPGEAPLTLETLVSRIHTDDRERTVQAIERAVRERRMLDVYYRVVRPSGAVRTLHCQARVVTEEGGRVVRLSGIAQDVTETSQADVELRESEARFRRLADSNIIGIVSWDAYGHISEANEAFLRTVGYTRADLWEGRLRWNELTPPEYHEVDAHALQELADRGVCMPYEKEYIRKDGTRVPILMGAAYLEPGSGRDLGICFVLDMSDRRYVEDALRESERGYRSLVETLPEAVLVQHQGIVLFANAAAAQLFGAPGVPQLVGRRLLDFIHPGSQMAVHARFEGRSAPDAEQAPISVLRFNGEVREVEILIAPALLEAQPAMQLILRDVTARRRAETELRQSEAQLRALLESASDALSVIGCDGVAIYHSPAVERITGYALQDLIGASWLDLVHPDDGPRVLRLWDEIRSAPGRTCTLEYRLRRPDGSWHLVESSAKLLPFFAPSQGIVVVTRDITWRHEGAACRRETDRAVPIYEAFSDIYLRLDSEGMVLGCHADESRRLLLPEQVFGRNVQQLFPSPTAGALSGAIGEVARSRRAMRLQYEMPVVNRAQRFEASLQPLRDGQILAIVRKVNGEMVAPLEVVLFSEVLQLALNRAAGDSVPFVESDTCQLEVLARRDELNKVLDDLLQAAVKSSHAGACVHIGCEARLAEKDADPGIQLQGRVRIRISGRGQAQTDALAIVQETLATMDGTAGFEHTPDIFVFWMDLAAARII